MRKIVEIHPKYEIPGVKAGKMLGSGSAKDAFEIIGMPDAVLLAKSPTALGPDADLATLVSEQDELNRIAAYGISTVGYEKIGIVQASNTFDGRWRGLNIAVALMKRYIGSDRSSDGVDALLDKLNDQTIHSLMDFMEKVEKHGVIVGDLQFLFDASGRAHVADPLYTSLSLSSAVYEMWYVVSRIIQAAKCAMRDRALGRPYGDTYSLHMYLCEPKNRDLRFSGTYEDFKRIENTLPLVA